MSYPDKLLDVDLSSRDVRSRDLPTPVARQFLGGRGLNIYFLSKLLSQDIGPLDPDNLLVLSCGLLTGTRAPSSSRLHVGALSPQTGLIGSSNVGGHFGAALRGCGLQCILIRGRASHPVQLRIDAGGAELQDASSVWGLNTRAAAQRLRDKIGRGVRTLVIGPAGENLVRYACLLTGTRHAAGRTGMGAVMGAKNLKAIAVLGGQLAGGPADDEGRRAVRAYTDIIRSSPRFASYSRFSNSAHLDWAADFGMLGTRNFQTVQFEGVDQIDGKRLIDYVAKPRTCHRCPVHCKAEILIPDGPYAGTRGERPDIEPIMNLGAKCGLDDAEALLYLYTLTSDLGLDAISTGGVLAFAMELYQRGLIGPADTGGLELTWGDAEAMEAMILQIAHRTGFGEVLAQGVRRAAAIIGGGAEQYAHHAKGLELVGYDPRGAMGTALGYAVSTRGADFTSVYAVPEYRWEPEQGQAWFGDARSVDRSVPHGKGRLVRRSMIVSAVLDAIGICKFPALSIVGDFSLRDEAALVSSLAGWDLDAEDLALAGERILNLERLFNLRHGAGPEADDLPDRFVEERITDPGPTQGMVVPIQQLVLDFYRAMGWTPDGLPSDEKLEELGLTEFAT
ncbi:MAG: aldehyde ferredoxin oxidoreductase family protein [Anaerolineae bacterium]|jgi:aldehyde:ferredoxin oxidoreductase